MAARTGAKLPQGTSIVDFRSPAAILAALGSEKVIRAEYSRQRSIIRKRIERMEKAGETTNTFYQRFGDMKRAIPTAKGLSTEEMSQRLAAMARAIGGGYQSTLTDVKAARKTAMERVRQEAEEAGDDITADFLGKELTPKQAEKVGRVWNIVRGVMGRSLGKLIGSGDMDVKIHRIVMGGKQSVLSMAAQVLSDYDADIATLETLQERFTQTGKTRVAWAKAHGRGNRR